jgi:hypothetical protein
MHAHPGRHARTRHAHLDREGVVRTREQFASGLRRRLETPGQNIGSALKIAQFTQHVVHYRRTAGKCRRRY